MYDFFYIRLKGRPANRAKRCQIYNVGLYSIFRSDLALDDSSACPLLCSYALIMRQDDNTRRLDIWLPHDLKLIILIANTVNSQAHRDRILGQAVENTHSHTFAFIT